MKRLEGKTALITGCNRGIGRSIMERFMEEGANIIACTRSMSPDLEAYYEESRAKYSIDIYPVTMDLSNEESVNKAVKDVFAMKLSVHVLVNNAGVACFDGLMRLSSEKMKEVFQINYFSPMMLIKSLIMVMMKAKGASIINLASVAGMDGTAGNCSYGASKASMILATKTLSKELSKAQIRVNAIAPNIVATDMSKDISDHLLNQQIQASSIQRSATPEEVANVALFLASDESSFLTGQTIRVDGGL